MEDFVKLQKALEHKINKSFENFKKKGLAQMTKGATQIKMKALEKLWEKYEAANNEMEQSGEADEKNPYFKNNQFEAVEEIFLERMGEFQEHINVLEAPSSTSFKTLNISAQPAQPNLLVARAKIPPLPLPSFEGDYLQWSAFKNLFDAAIASQDLTDIEKITFLRGCLKGDPLDSILDQPVVEGNFVEIWRILTEQYENNRRVVTLLLDRIVSLKPMMSPSAAEVKKIHKGVTGPLATLKTIGRSVDQWDDILVFLTASKFHPKLKKEWEDSLGSSTDPPKFAAITKFLRDKQTAAESFEAGESSKNGKSSTNNAPSNSSSQSKSSKNHDQKSGTKAFATDVGKTWPKCCCTKVYDMSKCKKFLAMSQKQRYTFLLQNRRCFNCFFKHQKGECKSQSVCNKCQRPHHDLMHFEPRERGSDNVDSSSSSSAGSEVSKPSFNKTHQNSSSDKSPAASSTFLTRTLQASPETVLLATAWVNIENEVGNRVTVRVLVDQCSQSSFISESLCQRLKLHKKSTCVPVNGLGSKRQVMCKGFTEFLIKPHFASTYSCPVMAYVIPKITNYKPVTKKQEYYWEHLQGLTLADPHYHRTGVIDALLGAEVHARIVEGRVIKGSEQQPIATETQLGWIISGATTSDDSQRVMKPTVLHCSAEPCVNDLLQKFWSQEELLPAKKQTREEEECDQHFKEHVTRLPNGSYQVRLPFKSSSLPSFKDTYASSLKLLHRMEARFERDSTFKDAYHGFIREYLDLGDMSLLTGNAEEFKNHDECCFLPHHGVLKETSSTTKLRTVFNGSMKTKQGYALNDYLHVGENLLPDLASLTLSWRNYQYAFTADIEKMFRRILVHRDDQRWQLILWRFDTSKPVEIYRLKTVTYGLGCSPFLANRVMKQLAQDEKDKYPLGSNVLYREIYMDDVLSGSHTLKVARSKQNETINLCKAGGFKLRKWLANDKSLLSLPADLLAVEPSEIAENESCFAILGLKWQPKLDHFQFSVKNEEMVEVWTKRLVLSKVAKLFDPLGWLAPVIVLGKIFLQQLWLLNLDWDTALPSDMAKTWIQWYEQLPAINEIRIPRWTGFMPTAASIQLHGFADASKSACGSVVYLRAHTSRGISVRLLQAKSKVAPLKTLSIPRLELSAAHLLAKLTACILPLFAGSKLEVYLWSDSLDVLHWLREIPSKWPTFIANRCADIHNLVPQAHWSHIRSEQNPADHVSRGVLPSDLENLRIWWSAPSWLSEEQDEWPVSLLQFPLTPSSDTPKIPEVASCATIVKKNVDNKEKLQGIWKLFTICSTWHKLVRKLAYLLRLVDFLGKKHVSRSELRTQTWYSISIEFKDKLSVAEMERARYVWVYLAQRYYFQKEVSHIFNGRSLLKSSPLYNLDPFISESLLFVGGRLKNSLLSLDEKFPIILPSDSRVSQFIVKDFHARTLHGGVQLTLATLRRQFWLIGGRQKVKRAINLCHPCIRYRASEYYQKMGNLPLERTRSSRPFEQSGVDYAGPIQVRVAPGRGQKSYKGYICIFVCLSTKAVHVEIVSDLTSEAFIAAFIRFVSRRGPCKLLWSDQGRNFVGADKILRKLYEQYSEHVREIKAVLIEKGTEWRFNAPAAPHFGGIWESAVKSTKHHIRRVLGNNTLTFEEMSTFTSQIEACLNSRPLMPLTDDSSDCMPLTPAHFLIQSASYIVPEPSYIDEKIPATKRWKLIQQMVQGFWRRWSREYLQLLQPRRKWQTATRSFKVNDLVILRDEDTPPAHWPLARVLAVQPDAKGLVRTVTVRTPTATYVRPAVKLILLPKEEDLDDEDS